jgi:Tfp pilus assembly protein PilV
MREQLPSNPPWRRTHSRAFTLIEALVATIILATGVLAATKAIGDAGRAVQQARLLDGAVRLADTKLEAATCLMPQQIAAASGDQALYHWELTFTEPLQTETVPLVVAQIRIVWQSSGKPESYSLAKAFLPHAPSGGGGE